MARKQEDGRRAEKKEEIIGTDGLYLNAYTVYNEQYFSVNTIDNLIPLYFYSSYKIVFKITSVIPHFSIIPPKNLQTVEIVE